MLPFRLLLIGLLRLCAFPFASAATPFEYADALEWTESAISSDNDAQWTYSPRDARDGSDALSATLSASAPSAWIQTTINGPGTLTVWARFKPGYLSTIFYDAEIALIDDQGQWLSPQLASYDRWTKYQFPIPASGPATIRLGGRLRSNRAWQYVQFSLDAFSYSQSPVIITQPSGGISLTSNSLSATAFNATSYQWFKDGNAIPGATNPYHSVAPQGLIEAGDYHVVCYNEYGQTASRTVTVDRADAPGPAIEQSQSFATLDGSAAWQTQTIDSIDGHDALRATLRDPSKVADLNFYLSKSTTIDFWWKADAPGLSVLFNGQVLRGFPSSPEWKRAIVPIPQSGYVTLRYKTPDSFAGTSSAYLDQLKVHQTPSITIATQSEAFDNQSTLTISSTTNEPTSHPYQWFKDSKLIAGQTQSTLTIPNASAADQGDYLAAISDGFTESRSNIVHMRIRKDYSNAIDSPNVLFADNATGAVAIETTDSIDNGNSVAFDLFPGYKSCEFTHRLDRAAKISFWWKIKSTQCDTNVTFYPRNSSGVTILSESGQWQFVETTSAAGEIRWSISSINKCGARILIDSLKVEYTPIASGIPNRKFLQPGESTTISPTLAHAEAVSYQWRLNGQPVPGQTNKDITIFATDIGTIQTYDLLTTNDFGTSISNPVLVESYNSWNDILETDNLTWKRSETGTISIYRSGGLDDPGSLLLNKTSASQPCWVETEIEGPFHIAFLARATNDKLIFYIDGVPIRKPTPYGIPVMSALVEQRITTPGTHTLRWEAGPSHGLAAASIESIAITQCLDITAHPRSGNIIQDDLLLSIEIANPPSPINYQWRRDGQPIPGATSKEYRADQPGSYDVQVNSGDCHYLSSIATVNTDTTQKSVLPRSDLKWFTRGWAQWTIIEEDTFEGGKITRFTPQTYFPKESISVGFEVEGPTNLSIEYSYISNDISHKKILLNGVPIEDFSGSYKSTLNINVDHPGTNTIEFQHTLIDEIFAIYPLSGLAFLNIENSQAPLFEENPISLSVFTGQSATFESQALSLDPSTLRYQWNRNGLPIPGETDSTLTIQSVTAAHSGEYSNTATDRFGSTTSRTVNLLASNAVSELFPNYDGVFSKSSTLDWKSIRTTLSDNELALGIIYDGTSSWIETMIEGPGTLSFDSHQIRQSSQTPCCIDFTVSIDGKPQGILHASLTSIRLPEGPHTVRWTLNNSSSPTLTNEIGAYIYNLRFFNRLPISINSLTRTVPQGTEVELTGQPPSGAPQQYQWFRNDQPIPDANSRSLKIANSTIDDTGSYRYSATSASGAFQSDTLELTVYSDPGSHVELPNQKWTHSGSGHWMPSASESSRGETSLVSPSLASPGSHSELSLTVQGPIQFSFDAKKSYSGFEDDFSFYIDGKKSQINLEYNWTTYSYAINDNHSHTLSWRHSVTTDSYISHAASIFIDNLRIDPLPPHGSSRTYYNWVEASFPQFVYTDISDYFGDPDGDGITNKTEFEYGLNPLAPNLELAPGIDNLTMGYEHVGDHSYLIVQFESSVPNFILRMEVSEDLKNWQPRAATVSTSIASGKTRYTLRSTDPASPPTDRFARIAIGP